MLVRVFVDSRCVRATGDASNTWGRKHFDGLIHTYGVAGYVESYLQSEIGYEH